MPTYEYICSKCEHEFEKVQAITEGALTVCPKELCARKPWGKGKVKRRISAGGGLIFKGSGFYSTDYRSESYKAAAKKDGEASKPAEAKTEKTGGSGSTAPSTTSNSTTSSSATPPPASKAGKD